MEVQRKTVNSHLYHDNSIYFYYVPFILYGKQPYCAWYFNLFQIFDWNINSFNETTQHVNQLLSHVCY